VRCSPGPSPFWASRSADACSPNQAWSFCRVRIQRGQLGLTWAQYAENRPMHLPGKSIGMITWMEFHCNSLPSFLEPLVSFISHTFHSSSSLSRHSPSCTLLQARTHETWAGIVTFGFHIVRSWNPPASTKEISNSFPARQPLVSSTAEGRFAPSDNMGAAKSLKIILL
jgi:hypothetical protein